MNDQLVFGFDVGIGSLGLSVRKGPEFLNVESLLIDAEVGSLADERKRRRAYVTRMAKRSREEWLQKVWREMGKEPLYGQREENGEFLPGDPRLEREFPQAGDDTVYNSALLRIKLLQGEKLEDWQIYKAIRSAFQRRGYDEEVSWSKKAKKKTSAKTKDEKEFEEKKENFQSLLEEMTDDPKYHFPAYLDAWRMGLWDPRTGKIRLRLSHKQELPLQRARNIYIASRESVEKELTALLQRAAERIPLLKGKENYILYGEKGEPYAYTNKWEGVLAQKCPRFDNRVVSSCSAIPRFKVCRSDYLGNYEVIYLLKLRNLQYDTKKTYGKLNPEQIRYWYRFAKNKVKASNKDNIAVCFKITKSEWKKWLEKEGLGSPIPKNDVVEAPKTEGRSRFSKIALKLIKDLILSGNKPRDFHREVIEHLGEYRTKLQEKDLNFLLEMENDWEKIHIPALDLKARIDHEDELDTDTMVKKLIGTCGNPLVRHRSQFFDQQLQRLLKEYGRPDRIVIEFVREDFMGEKAKKKYELFHQKRKEEYEKVLKEYDQSVRKTEFIKNKKKKLSLLHEQNHQCPYTGAGLSLSRLNSYEIDHILPQGKKYGGESVMENLVITLPEINAGQEGKGERLPYEYFMTNKPGEWEGFKNRVEGMYRGKNDRKLSILTSLSKEEALGYMDRKKALNETSEIAVLTRSIVAARMDWGFNEEGEKKRIHVVSGGLVAKVRRRYGLNRLLGDGSMDEKKMREDHRHHALDAMIITFLYEWYRSRETVGFFKFPRVIENPFQYFKDKLEGVYPRQLVYAKAALGQTIYREITVSEKVQETGGKEGKILVYRKKLVEYLKLFDDTAKGEKGAEEKKERPLTEKEFKEVEKKLTSIIDVKLRKRIGQALERLYRQGKSKSEIVSYFIKEFKQSDDPHSPPVIKVTVKGDKSPKVARNLNKNQKHRGQFFISETGSSKGTRKHGYYLSMEGKVRAVESFESPFEVKRELKTAGWEIWEDEMIRRGMWLKIHSLVKPKNNEDIVPGTYQIKSFSNEQIKLCKPDGSVFNPVAASKILQQGKATLMR